ncbi:hypothetical protein [Nocardia sp. NBC_00416]|uniref:hypothetical protein n=1 Tax=Nocardia sp. NBC_00416 TaxID=2975991 RepID=UPI002E1E6DAE
MTGLQIAAAVVVCADIGIVFAALLWPEPHETEIPDRSAPLPMTAWSSISAEPARPQRGPGPTGRARTFLASRWVPAQRLTRRHSAQTSDAHDSGNSRLHATGNISRV